MEVVCSLQLKEKPVVKKKFCLPNGSTVVVGTIRTTERSGNSKLVRKNLGEREIQMNRRLRMRDYLKKRKMVFVCLTGG